MSRGYDARRKAKRRQARAAAEPPQRQSPEDSRRPVMLPVLAVAAILIATAILGLGAGNGSGRKQTSQEVTALLAGIPQHGATLGSLDAPVTLQMFADLECPTVKRFAESYLPSIINTWVRTGILRLEYRSLKTDTIDERTFFRQEEAALAAGRQNRMWNFTLTFVGYQSRPYTEYATEAFIAQIASQVPELNVRQWNQDRKDLSLFKVVALSVHSAHTRGLGFTPSFVISSTTDAPSVQDEIESSLERDIRALRIEVETSGDVPVLIGS